MKRIGLVVALVSAMLGVLGVGPGRAEPSQWCSDGTPTEIERTLLNSPVMIGVAVNPAGQVQVCYSTSPTAPGTAAGAEGVVLSPRPTPNGGGVWVYCASDTAVRQPVSCDEAASASTAPDASGTSAGLNGVTLGIQIPFQACLGGGWSQSGGCSTISPNLSKSGLIVGTLVPMRGPDGSTGAGYQVSNVEVWLDGSLIYSNATLSAGGAFVNYAIPGATLPSVGPSTPPCTVGGVCVPSLTGAVGIAGATESVTLVLPLAGPQTYPITIPSRCLVNFNGPCS